MNPYTVLLLHKAASVMALASECAALAAADPEAAHAAAQKIRDEATKNDLETGLPIVGDVSRSIAIIIETVAKDTSQ